jgi:hypothetical protein
MHPFLAGFGPSLMRLGYFPFGLGVSTLHRLSLNNEAFDFVQPSCSSASGFFLLSSFCSSLHCFSYTMYRLLFSYAEGL